MPASVSPWQNMDTAPKDGTRVLVAEYPNVACYLVSWRGWIIGDADLVDREMQWREVSNGRPVRPTRWLEIPFDSIG